MTPKQTYKYRALWKEVCRAQKWTCQDGVNTAAQREKRLDEHQRVFGDRRSSTEIRTNEECDAIFKRFEELASIINITEQPAKRDLWLIRNVMLPCLALYVEDMDGYLRSIFTERFNVFRGINTIEDLSDEPRFVAGVEKPSQLAMFKFTLAGRIQAKRKEAGDTGHVMKIKARVKCDCMECLGTRSAKLETRNQPEPEAVMEGQPF